MSPWLSLVRLTRAYSLPYVALLGALSARTSSPGVWGVLALGPCLWMLGAALNDLQHRKADALARPERRAAAPLLVPTVALAAVLSLTVLLQQGALALMAGALALASAATYGITKSVPLLSMLTRGVASSCLALAGAAGSGTSPNWYLVAAVGLMDAAGNGLGDLRDAARDRNAGTRTLATVHASLALGACQLLHLVALRLFALGHGVDATGWFALGLVGLVPMLALDDDSKHAGYLLFKYFTFTLHFAAAQQLELASAAALSLPLAAWLYTLSHGTCWSLAFRQTRASGANVKVGSLPPTPLRGP